MELNEIPPRKGAGWDPSTFPKGATFGNQFRALFFKQVVLRRRAYLSCIWQTIFPLIALGGLLLLTIAVNSQVAEKVKELRYPNATEPFFVYGRIPGVRYAPGPASLLHAVDPGVTVPAAAFADWEQGFSLINQTVEVRYVRFSQDGGVGLDPYGEKDVDYRHYNLTNLFASNETQLRQSIFNSWLQPKPPSYVAGYRWQHWNKSAFNFSTVILVNDSISSFADLPAAFALVTRAIGLSYNFTHRMLLKSFPKLKGKENFDLSSLAGPFFLTFLLHMLFPVFLGTVVYEKEKRLTGLMRMMGMRMNVWWLVNYVFFLTLYMGVLLFTVIGGFVTRLRIISITSPGVTIIFFFIWGNAMIALALFFSVFFKSSRTAAVIGYFYVILQAIIATFLIDNLVTATSTNQGIIALLSLWPSFALYRGLCYMGMETAFNGPGIKFSTINDSPVSMLQVWFFLIVEWAILMLLAVYLDQVIGDGIRKHPLFFLKKSYWQKRKQLVAGRDERDVDMPRYSPVAGEPDDVAAERQRVFSDDSLALRALNVAKTYPARSGDDKEVKALEDVTLGIAPGQCLGLLGSNGAGKSTFINILSGLFSPSSGTAQIYGFDIRTDIDRIHQLMGVCPQDNVIWEDLTGEEHLVFFGRLKNLSGKELDTAVATALEQVRLTEAKKKLAGKYSGGMKRRLCVAIAMIGNPKIVFLDEPSTGLDPASRYTLWSVISEVKKNCSMILTTHSMEEADALCDTLAMFAQGKLRTVGVSAQLKKRFGDGLKLTVTLNTKDTPPDVAAQKRTELIQFIQSTCNGTLQRELSDTFTFTIPTNGLPLSQLFAHMERNKARLSIADWAISNSTLEEVFLNVVAQIGGATKKELLAV